MAMRSRSRSRRQFLNIFGYRPVLSRLDENGPQQTFLAHLPDMFFLKFLKLQIEVRLPDQLPFLLYVVLFVND